MGDVSHAHEMPRSLLDELLDPEATPALTLSGLARSGFSGWAFLDACVRHYGTIPARVFTSIPPSAFPVEAWAMVRLAEALRVSGLSVSGGEDLNAAMHRVMREELRRGDAAREAWQRSRVVVRAPAAQFRQCDAREPTTGACCALPSGHLEPHRGPFAGGEMQWPYESERREGL